MSPRILFVDDDQNILTGLRRMLRTMKDEWEMAFAQGGEQALKIMNLMKVDVIVSDMRMPEMNGAELLTKVMELHPETVRIVLSGHSDIELVLKSVLPAHQYLSKPCEPEKLKDVVYRALNMSKIITNETVKKLISKTESLPVLPQVYNAVINELQKQECSMKEIGKIIAEDLGMTAKILKLVNSSFFGFARHISSAEQAVNLLGLNILRSVILYEHIFTIYQNSSLKNFKFEQIWEHSLNVARISRAIMETLTQDRKLIEDAFIAGMLHDLGKLILATNLTAQYAIILNRLRTNERPIWDLEMEVIGTTHAEVGAYLLGLWGLAEPVVEAIAFHHAPYYPSVEPRPLTSVYFANILELEISNSDNDILIPKFDINYLNIVNLADKIDDFRTIARDTIGVPHE